MIERQISINVHLSPEEVAYEFAGMDDSQQAAFFNELARLSSDWESPLCFQIQFITDNELLTPEARRVMEQIGEYSQKQ